MMITPNSDQPPAIQQPEQPNPKGRYDLIRIQPDFSDQGVFRLTPYQLENQKQEEETKDDAEQP